MMFQFLIGRLGTGGPGAGGGRDRRFQFLIGRLGTRHSLLEGPSFLQFQFLIGRLGTDDDFSGLGLIDRFNSS